MTQGVTGTFAINGVELLLQPSEHGWVDREPIGISGEDRPIYPSVRQYEMNWELMSMQDFAQLSGFCSSIQSSGSAVVDLPKYGTYPYQFYSYSGCQIKEPTAGKFYVTYVKSVSLLILKVRT